MGVGDIYHCCIITNTSSYKNVWVGQLASDSQNYFCFTLDMNWGILNKDSVLNPTFCFRPTHNIDIAPHTASSHFLIYSCDNYYSQERPLTRDVNMAFNKLLSKSTHMDVFF